MKAKTLLLAVLMLTTFPLYAQQENGHIPEQPHPVTNGKI